MVDEREQRRPERVTDDDWQPETAADEHLSNAGREQVPNDNFAAESREGVAARHLDWSDDETIGAEHGGRHAPGQMSDTLHPEESQRLMRERIERGPGDDISSYGDNIGAVGGGDIGVLGGMPGGGPTGVAGEATRQHGAGTADLGGLGGQAAENMGSVDADTPDLGGIQNAHAAGMGAGVDAGGVDMTLLPGAGGSDVDRLRDTDDRARDSEARRPADLPDDPAQRPVVSERLEGSGSSNHPAAPPDLGDDAGLTSDPTLGRGPDAENRL